MAIYGNYPVQSLPLVPVEQAATQVQVSGTVGVANRTVTTPVHGLSLSFDGTSVPLDATRQAPGDILLSLNEADVDCELDRNGALVLPNTAAVTGDSTLKTALGLA